MASQISDGLAQKLTIIFSNEQIQVGQRIVAGFFAAESASSEASTLAVADPEPHGLVVRIREDADPDLLRDTIRRADLARQFQQVGANSIALELLAMPEKNDGQQADRRRRFARLLSELTARLERRSDNDLLSRSVNFPMPERIQSVTVSHAIRESFIRRLIAYDPSKRTLKEQFPESDSLRLGWESIEHGYSASLHRGIGFVSELSVSY